MIHYTERPMLFATTLEQFESPDEGFFIHVPEEVASYYVNGSGRDVKCQLDGNLSFNGKIAESPMGQSIIPVSKFTANSCDLRPNQLLYIELSPNHGLFSCKMGDELSQALRMDKNASRVFYELSPGSQHSLVYFVDNMKAEYSKTKKAEIVIKHLLDGVEKVNFELLLDQTKATLKQQDGFQDHL